jgi:hypothetical protein
MSIEEYLASLETNAMILGIVALNMKNFASQIIQRVNGGGPLDDAGLAALKAKCGHGCARLIQDKKSPGSTGKPGLFCVRWNPSDSSSAFRR